MSLARQLRRQQKRGGADIANPLGQLQAVLGDLKKVSDLGDTARGVEALGSKLKEAQALVDELATQIDGGSGGIFKIAAG